MLERLLCASVPSLQGCVLVVTGASTVAIETILMEEAVAIVGLAEELIGIDFVDARATLQVGTPGELECGLR